MSSKYTYLSTKNAELDSIEYPSIEFDDFKTNFFVENPSLQTFVEVVMEITDLDKLTFQALFKNWEQLACYEIFLSS